MIFKYLGRCGSPAGAIRCRNEGQTTWTLIDWHPWAAAWAQRPLHRQEKALCISERLPLRDQHFQRGLVLKDIGWQSHFLGKALIPQWWEK